MDTEAGAAAIVTKMRAGAAVAALRRSERRRQPRRGWRAGWALVAVGVALGAWAALLRLA